MSNEDWEVSAHDDIEKLEDNLWRVEGSIPGMQLRRVMTLAKLPDGGTVVHNAVALDESMMQAIEGWGAPHYIVVPNGYHRMDCAKFKRRYPQAKVVCPKAAVKRVSEEVGVDLTYDEFPNDEVVTLRHLNGTNDNEGVMLVRHGETFTAVFNDLVFNMPHATGGIGFVLRYLTKSTGGPTVSRIARWLVIKDKRAVADELDAIAKTPGLSRVIVSHHQTIATDVSATLQELAASLR